MSRINRWKGKVAVVTGASVGIGAEIATTLADLGIIVVGLARRKEMIQKLPTKGVIHAIACDLTKDDDIAEAFRWVEKNLGGVDILINNAGVLKLSSLIDGDIDDWKKIINLNVISLCVCSQEALRSMMKKEEGHIININSKAGHLVPHIPQLHFGPYTASKFSVTALSGSLKTELNFSNSNIKVTSISPGPVQTAMLKEISDHLESENQIEDKYILTTEDIAEVVVFALGTRPGVQIDEIQLQPGGPFYM